MSAKGTSSLCSLKWIGQMRQNPKVGMKQRGLNDLTRARLSMRSYDSAPRPPFSPLFRELSKLPLYLSLISSLLTGESWRGVWVEPNHTTQKSLTLYKSFNALWGEVWRRWDGPWITLYKHLFSVLSYSVSHAMSNFEHATSCGSRRLKRMQVVREEKLMYGSTCVQADGNWRMGDSGVRVLHCMCDSVLLRFFYACVHNCQIWNLKYISISYNMYWEFPFYIYSLKAKLRTHFLENNIREVKIE